MAEFAAKFLPVTVTVVPAGPLVGFSDIVVTGGGGIVTVNCAEAEFADASVALTVWVPKDDGGIVIDPAKLPVESVVIVLGFVVIVVPPYVILILEFEAKPLPVTVTVVPVGPLDGFSDIVGVATVVTVNDADAEPADASVALTV